VVERAADATARGAEIRGYVAGYGTAFDPPKLEARLLHASSGAVARAIKGALDDAGCAASDVDVVCSSLGGLPPFDRAEAAGIVEMLGDAVPIAAPKAIWGESFSGAAALGMASAVTWLEGVAPGPIVRGEAPGEVATAVVVSVGYYGNVSAVVLRRA
jgi:3-oxoacyl-(acyl-carrier-protein) synthase